MDHISEKKIQVTVWIWISKVKLSFRNQTSAPMKTISLYNTNCEYFDELKAGKQVTKYMHFLTTNSNFTNWP